MSLSNEEKMLLERTWISTTNQLGEEFQRALEDLRELCARADSAESDSDAYELILDRLRGWRDHFVKYREVAAAHPIGDPQSYARALDAILTEVKGAIKTFEDRQAGFIDGERREKSPAEHRRTLARKLIRDTLREKAAELNRLATPPATPPVAPPAPPPAAAPAAAQPSEDPLVRLAKIRAEEREDIARRDLEMVKFTADSGRRRRGGK